MLKEIQAGSSDLVEGEPGLPQPLAAGQHVQQQGGAAPQHLLQGLQAARHDVVVTVLCNVQLVVIEGVVSIVCFIYVAH